MFPRLRRLIAQTKETPSWNFCKYLVGKDGRAIKYYKNNVKPEDAGSAPTSTRR
jgi:glutathione peroxidase-family protein